MESSFSGRRATDSFDRPDTAIADTVRRGMLISETAGAVSAVEFLKARGVDPTVIERVLGGAEIRRDDAVALAHHTLR